MSFMRSITNFAHGQIIAALLVGQYISVAYMQPISANAPTFQAMLIPTALAIVVLIYIICRHKRDVLTSLSKWMLHQPWWIWLVLAIADVESNVFTLIAIAQTSISSNYTMVGLVLQATLPFMAILSFTCLRKRFGIMHIIGCAIVSSSIPLAFCLDLDGNEFTTVADELPGKLYALAAAFCFAISNVLQDYAIQRQPQTASEITVDPSLIGICARSVIGVVIALIQMVCLGEFGSLSKLSYDNSIITSMVCYILSVIVLIGIMTFVVRSTHSIVFQWSMQSSDAYNALVVFMCFRAVVPLMFWIIFAIQLIGVGFFSLQELPTSPQKNILRENQNETFDLETSNIVKPMVPVLVMSPPSDHVPASPSSMYYLDDISPQKVYAMDFIDRSNADKSESSNVESHDSDQSSVVYANEYFHGRQVATLEDSSPRSSESSQVSPSSTLSPFPMVASVSSASSSFSADDMRPNTDENEPEPDNSQVWKQHSPVNYDLGV